MSKVKLNILIIEEDLNRIELIKQYLDVSSSVQWNIQTAHRLVDGLGVLSLQPIDIVLTALDLPDSMESAGVKLVQEHISAVPIVIVANDIDVSKETELMEIGVQDYLIADNCDSESLDRALRLAIARQKLLLKYKNAEDKLALRIIELEKMNDLMVNREIVITSLKRELREIQQKQIQ